MPVHVVLTDEERSIWEGLVAFIAPYKAMSKRRLHDTVSVEDLGFASAKRDPSTHDSQHGERDEFINGFLMIDNLYLELISLRKELDPVLKQRMITEFLSGQEIKEFVTQFVMEDELGTTLRTIPEISLKTARLKNNNSLPFYQEVMKYLERMGLIKSTEKVDVYTLVEGQGDKMKDALVAFYLEKISSMSLFDLVTQQQSRSDLGADAALMAGGQRNDLIDDLVKSNSILFQKLKIKPDVTGLYLTVRTFDSIINQFEEIIINLRKKESQPHDINDLLFVRIRLGAYRAEQGKIKIAKELVWIIHLLHEAKRLKGEKTNKSTNDEGSSSSSTHFLHTAYESAKQYIGDSKTGDTQQARRVKKVLFYEAFEKELTDLYQVVAANVDGRKSAEDLHIKIQELLDRYKKSYENAFLSDSFTKAITAVEFPSESYVVQNQTSKHTFFPF